MLLSFIGGAGGEDVDFNTLREDKDFEISCNVPIPLQSVVVEASIFHVVAHVEIEQVYVNKEEHPIQTVYYFPIDSNGAVVNFEAKVDQQLIRGSVKGNEKATEQYEKAVEQKHTAFMWEENKSDIFKVRIGWLKPGSHAKIIIRYVTEVKHERDSNFIRFTVPSTVAPHYVPPNPTDEKAKDLKKMKFHESSRVPMKLRAHLYIQGGIESIHSPTHEVRIDDQEQMPGTLQPWTKATVALCGFTTDMDRDFVVLISAKQPYTPRLYYEKRGTESLAVMAHMIPRFKFKEQRTELIFVLDRSKSMQGKNIQLAKTALMLFLRSLPLDCYFNIVGFGSSYEFLFSNSVKHDDDSLTQAMQHITSLDADMGCALTLEPLKNIYNSELIPEYLRQIFLITDGKVGNADEILGLTKAKAHGSRVFALGIGHGASHHLVDGIANAGGGNSAFVSDDEPVDKKVLQLLKNALQPSPTNVRTEWLGTQPIQEKIWESLMGYGAHFKEPVNKYYFPEEDYAPLKNSYHQPPEEITPIFDGSQFHFFSVFDGPYEKPAHCVVTADLPDGRFSHHIPISEFSDLRSLYLLHKLAAMKVVREIELKICALRFVGAASGDQEDMINKLKREIVRIAVREGIASKYTSFVGVDYTSDGETPYNWVMQTRVVPSHLPHGFNETIEDSGML